MSVVARQSMEGVILTASKLHVIMLVPDGEELSFYSIAYNLIAPEKLISSSVDSVFAVMTTKEGEAPLMGVLPKVAKFGAIDDMVVVAIKQTPMFTYLWGLSVEELIGWKAPASATQPIDEDKLFGLQKVPHADLKELVELENTATHPHLKAMLDKLISHCPTFKAAKIKAAADMVRMRRSNPRVAARRRNLG
jgi:hypothetical protein